ncbi:hypothetical protein [Kineosporia sp. NBRC 101731]|uniref:hypothetical protein n=1 Tax=Kineosporia sp. NBRC 101731 TaxID=3032199 RepID=UPI0024A60ADE|nr:hypothetical protein [Kineosporia sp. NBRC 101731]GLY32082.1 hypothetical protein Kisp02_54470 [Kineosporia sp. NBRC 101731]
MTTAEAETTAPDWGTPEPAGMQPVPQTEDDDGVLDDIEEMVADVKRLIIAGPVAAITALDATAITGSASWLAAGPAGLAIAGGTTAATAAVGYAAHRAHQKEKAAKEGKPDPKAVTSALKQAEKARTQAEKARAKTARQTARNRATGLGNKAGWHATTGRGALSGLSMPSRGARKGPAGFSLPKAGGGSRGSAGTSRTGAAAAGKGAMRGSKPSSPLSRGAGIGAGKTGPGKPGAGIAGNGVGAKTGSRSAGLGMPTAKGSPKSGGGGSSSRGGSRSGGSGLLSRPGSSGGGLFGRKAGASGSGRGAAGKGLFGGGSTAGRSGAGGSKGGGHAKGAGGFGTKARGGGAHRTARGPLGRLRNAVTGRKNASGSKTGTSAARGKTGANTPAKSSRLGRAVSRVAGPKNAARLGKAVGGAKRVAGAAKRGYQTGRAAIRGAASARGKSPMQIARAAGAAIARQQAKHGQKTGKKIGRIGKFRRRVTRTALALGLAGSVAAWRGMRTSGAWMKWLAFAAVLRAFGKEIPDNPRVARDKKEAKKRRQQEELDNPPVRDTVNQGPGPALNETERSTAAMSAFALQLKAKADEMVSLASSYTPEGMVQWGEDMAGLEEVLASVASVIQVLQQGTDQLPIDPAVRNAIEPVISCQMSTASTAGEIRNVFEIVHAAELERLRNPRPNEAMWDTVNNQA